MIKNPLLILAEFQSRTAWDEYSEKVLLALFISSRENYDEQEFRSFLSEQAHQAEERGVGYIDSS
jgi:hypothetical protein